MTERILKWEKINMTELSNQDNHENGENPPEIHPTSK